MENFIELNGQNYDNTKHHVRQKKIIILCFGDDVYT